MSDNALSNALLYGDENDCLTEVSVGGKDIRLHREVHAPLVKLADALADANLPVVIVSAWRSFDHQCSIWNAKWSGTRPILDRNACPLDSQQLSDESKFNALCYWSAIPGTSRHHWGTDFDIFLQQPIAQGYSVQLTPDEFSETGVCAELEQWLSLHLESFGFYRPYRKEQGGVSPEPWHISYFPIANQCLGKVRATDAARKIKQSNLQGKEVVLNHLDDYFSNYVFNVESAPQAAS